MGYYVEFENGKGIRRKIGSVEDYQSAMRAITEFLRRANYTSYYQRIWEISETEIKVDVGSYTEFFYVTKDNTNTSWSAIISGEAR